MRSRTHVALASLAVAGLAFALAAPDASAGRATGRPTQARSKLAVPDEGPDPNAKCRVDAKHFPENRSRAERSWLRFRMHRLDRATEYSLWIDDPATEEVDLTEVTTFTTHGRGNAKVRYDTKHGDTLPFGATLAALAGLACEIRDGEGATVLAGNLPDIH